MATHLQLVASHSVKGGEMTGACSRTRHPMIVPQQLPITLAPTDIGIKRSRRETEIYTQKINSNILR